MNQGRSAVSGALLAAFFAMAFGCESTSTPTPVAGTSSPTAAPRPPLDPDFAATAATTTHGTTTPATAARPRVAPDNDPSKRPATNAPGCDADPRHCCTAAGEIRYPCCGGALPPECSGKSFISATRDPDGMCGMCTSRCLPEGVRVATPSGEVPLASLAVGDTVWTLDGSGRRVAARVLRLAALPVISEHELVRVRLDDGRSLAASPGHPTADGRTLAGLRAGELLDGARVLSATRVPYTGTTTLDLRPAGPTGAYWADGVLVGSTLE